MQMLEFREQLEEAPKGIDRAQYLHRAIDMRFSFTPFFRSFFENYYFLQFGSRGKEYCKVIEEYSDFLSERLQSLLSTNGIHN
jgi:hypothetical protein